MLDIPKTIDRILSPTYRLVTAYRDSFYDGTQRRFLERLFGEAYAGGAMNMLYKAREGWDKRMEQVHKIVEKQDKKAKEGGQPAPKQGPPVEEALEVLGSGSRPSKTSEKGVEQDSRVMNRAKPRQRNSPDEERPVEKSREADDKGELDGSRKLKPLVDAIWKDGGKGKKDQDDSSIDRAGRGSGN